MVNRVGRRVAVIALWAGVAGMLAGAAQAGGQEAETTPVVGGAPATRSTAPLSAPAPLDGGRWLRGDLHLHSRHSRDSTHNSVATLVGFAEQTGMDFLAITDHDNHVEGDVANNTWSDPEYRSDTVILLYGAEWTTHRGHAIMLAAAPYDHQTLYDVRDDRDAVIGARVEALGVHVSPAHPSGKDAFSISYDFAHSLEVWNSVLFDSGLMVWDDLLKSGRRITGRGGSDAHYGRPAPGEASSGNTFERRFNYVGTPTTWVYALDETAEGVLAALESGRVAISANPNSPRVELYADLDGDGAADAMMGDMLQATGRTVAFDVRVTGDAAEGRSYRVSVVRDGRELTTLRTDPETGLARFEDVPPLDARSYYRVEVRGWKGAYREVPLAGYLGGDLVGLSNPIYFNFDPEF